MLAGALETTALAREHLLPESPYFVGDYMGLAAESAEVIDLVERLRSNRPADIDQQGHAYLSRWDSFGHGSLAVGTPFYSLHWREGLAMWLPL